MSEKYDFKIFNNALKKEFLLNQIFELEVQLFGLHVAEVPDGHPEFVDWKYAFDECLKQLNKIRNNSITEWSLTDCLIVHRYGKLHVNDKIVLIACYAENRDSTFQACKSIMDYLKKDAPFWKKEYYDEGFDWLENVN